MALQIAWFSWFPWVKFPWSIFTWYQNQGIFVPCSLCHTLDEGVAERNKENNILPDEVSLIFKIKKGKLNIIELVAWPVGHPQHFWISIGVVLSGVLKDEVHVFLKVQWAPIVTNWEALPHCWQVHGCGNVPEVITVWSLFQFLFDWLLYKLTRGHGKLRLSR